MVTIDWETRTGFERTLSAYLGVEVFDPPALKAQLDIPALAGMREEFRAGLAAAMAGGGLDQARYEALTGDEFDAPGDYADWLRRLHGFLFEGGPPAWHA
jgi:hypothetical protein